MPPELSGHTRLEMKRGLYFVQKLDEKRTKFSLYIYVDPKLSMAPKMVINTVMIQTWKELIENLKKISKNIMGLEYG